MGKRQRRRERTPHHFLTKDEARAAARTRKAKVPPEGWSREIPFGPESFMTPATYVADEVAEALEPLAPDLEEAKKDWSDPTPEERKALWEKFPQYGPERAGHSSGAFSLHRDSKGLFIHTHRARSKSYATVADIPESVADFIESTG